MIDSRLVDKPLILYGYGRLGHLAEEIFNELKIPIHAIVDRTTFTVKNNKLLKKDMLVAVCVAIEPFQSVKKEICALGFFDIVPVWDIIEAYPEVGIHNGWFAGTYSKEDVVGARFVALQFRDNISRVHYKHFRQRRRGLKVKLSSALTYTPIPIPSLPSTLADIRHRQGVDMFADVPMDKISIHNEGCELKTLEVNMPLFQKYRPQIDVACYHSRDGLWKIERFLMDNLPDYTWTFRLHAYMGQAAYIIGIPKERREK